MPSSDYRHRRLDLWLARLVRREAEAMVLNLDVSDEEIAHLEFTHARLFASAFRGLDPAAARDLHERALAEFRSDASVASP